MNKTPWELQYTPWRTQSAFYNYIRGGLRKALWSRHPVKIAYLQKMRFKVPLGKPTEKNPDGMVWACKCEICGEVFRQSDCEVDHINPAGSLSCEDDLKRFITQLSFVDFNDLRILDKECHRIVSYAERMGITLEEAALEKERVKFFKQKVKDQKEQLLEAGASEDDLKNIESRKKAFYLYISQVQKSPHEEG